MLNSVGVKFISIVHVYREVYRELHEVVGHLGVEGILALARQRFYRPNTSRDVENITSTDAAVV